MISVNQKIEIFFSYAHQDEELRDELAKHLKLLQRQGIIRSRYQCGNRLGRGDRCPSELSANYPTLNYHHALHPTFMKILLH